MPTPAVKKGSIMSKGKGQTKAELLAEIERLKKIAANEVQLAIGRAAITASVRTELSCAQRDIATLKSELDKEKEANTTLEADLDKLSNQHNRLAAQVFYAIKGVVNEGAKQPPPHIDSLVYSILQHLLYE